jgi:hypothetical protein
MYHKIIFTYLTLDIKYWLWLWDLILLNISGDPTLFRPLIFFHPPRPPSPCIILTGNIIKMDTVFFR